MKNIKKFICLLIVTVLITTAKKIYMLAYSDSTYNAVNRNSGGHLQRIF